jgi:hypothetical protein
MCRPQRGYDTKLMLTQHALFCIDMMAKRVTLSQHFMMHVVASIMRLRKTEHSEESQMWIQYFAAEIDVL